MQSCSRVQAAAGQSCGGVQSCGGGGSVQAARAACGMSSPPARPVRLAGGDYLPSSPRHPPDYPNLTLTLTLTLTQPSLPLP